MNERKPIRCLVVDDEPPARELLARYIETVPMLELQGTCGNALEALDRLQTGGTDLLFLDIHLPQLKGTDLLRVLRNPPPVILTTAYPEYALEGYDLNVLDYLLKPIQLDRFLKAVGKLTESASPITEMQPVRESADPFIYLRVDRKMVKVPLTDILFVESMKDYVKVCTRAAVLVTKQSITAMEAMLPEAEFLRTHRSFIVAKAHVRAYTHELIEIDKAEVPIGKLFRQQVLRALGG
ncbi:MAG: response regulator transcription factor [Chitinophagaceae bacterium]|nr:MAG: response regulator transcription factor [Chitinophagaceae bacterium]